MATSIFSILVICLSFIVNIAVSNGYLYSRICRPSTVLVRGVFVATFGLSASLLELCLWEINGLLQKEARGIAWKLVIRILLADLIVVIPFLLSYTLFAEYVPSGLSRGYRFLIPGIPFVVFIYLFYQLGALLPLPEKTHFFWRVESRSLTEECVLRIGAMGITLMAVLSGFGSICAGWETYLARHRLVSEADVVRARTSVEMTQELIKEKRRKIQQLEGRIHEKSKEPSSFMNRVVTSVRGSSDHQELAALKAELNSLSQMHSSLISQHSSLQSLHARQSRQNTPFGLLSLLARHLFALYCLYRILATGYSNIRLLLFGRHPTTADEDPVSRILALLTQTWTTAPLDIESYRRLIGFVLVGVVIAGSINAVISTIQRVSKRAPLEAGTTTLAISWIGGTYFVSTAVMLRSGLPEKYIGGIGNALGSSVKRGTFDGWFDLVYFGVAAVTSIGLLVARTWSEDDIMEVEGKEV